MGTNYYLRLFPCPTCHKSDESLHIGKSSYGWTFSFRGYDGSTGEPVIKSEKDWRRVMKEPDRGIYDEYGRNISYKRFWQLVSKKKISRNNHTDYCKEHYPGEECGKNWKDDKGNSFSGYIFS